MSDYIHQIPGRLRIKSQAIKRNQTTAEAAEALLKAVSGIRSVAVNTVTGSIVIHHDSQSISSETILGTLKRHGYFDASKAMTHDQVFQTAASSVGLFLGKTLCGAVLETAFEDSALSVIAALI